MSREISPQHAAAAAAAEVEVGDVAVALVEVEEEEEEEVGKREKFAERVDEVREEEEDCAPPEREVDSMAFEALRAAESVLVGAKSSRRTGVLLEDDEVEAVIGNVTVEDEDLVEVAGVDAD